MSKPSTTQVTVPQAAARRTAVPRRATLDGFVDETAESAAAGVMLASIEPLTTLLVHTENSIYRLIVRGGSRVLVQGGRFFPTLTDAYLAGSGFGGSMLKLGWIGLGLRMEICTNGRPVVTSPVQFIGTERADSSGRPV